MKEGAGHVDLVASCWNFVRWSSGESANNMRSVVRATQSPTAMLHIRMLSGEEVASIPVGVLTDARELKLPLRQLHGFPTRFTQRPLSESCRKS